MTTGNAGMPSLADVSDAEWAALAQRRIFFGHQSVGGNIMAGVAEVIAAQPRIGLRVVESRELRNAPPAFHHGLVGRNDHPLEKIDDFVRLVAAGFGTDGGIAMMKLCYVDIHKHTEAQALFEEYRERIDALKVHQPAMRIVHVTAPLTGIENWKGRLRAALTGVAANRDRNVVRHRFNELMRRAYEGREPVFDLALMESTLPDGTRALFRSGNEDVPLLAAPYSDDGGHLNALARRRVAEQLLIMLARLDCPTPSVRN